MRELGDKRGPSDNILCVVMGVREYKEALIDLATFCIQVDEVVEEKSDGSVVVCDDLCMNLGCMSNVFGLSGGVKVPFSPH